MIAVEGTAALGSHHPSFVELAELVADGRVGEVDADREPNMQTAPGAGE